MTDNCILYRSDEQGVAHITLNRPDKRNAQDSQLTYALDEAFKRAAFDDEVKVIVLDAAGPHFSSGHDLADNDPYPDAPIGLYGGMTKPGTEGHMAFEEEVYLHLCRRWQQIPKPTIAQVHGKVIAGGLMLMWVCDLIVASEEATFTDLTVNFGVNGVEWFAHPWELGIRKAKEMLFTGDPISAADAHRLGMVNHVVAKDDLPEFTQTLAEKIASRPAFALKLAKMSCNQALDAQGFFTAQQAAFSLQHVGHSQTRERHYAKKLRESKSKPV